MKSRMLPFALAILFLAPFALAGTGPEARLDCPDPTRTLPAGPEGLPATPPEQTLRFHPNGAVTLVTTIDEPAEGTYYYNWIDTPATHAEGTYTHPWETDRPMMSVGVIVRGIHVPLVVLEGRDLVGGVQDDALDIATLAADGVTSLLHGIYDEFVVRSDDAYEGAEPGFVWTSYRKIEGRELWSGFALVRQASSEELDGVAVTCLRSEILLVKRTEADTTALGGVFLEATKTRAEEPSVESVAVGVVAGLTALGVDAPSVATRADRLTTDDARRANELSIGVRDERGAYHPLLGVRQENVRAAAPEAFNGMMSIGAYRSDGAFVPAVGLRTHFERFDPLGWVDTFSSTGGLGTRVAGDWEADAGAFDAFGRFTPLVGTTYDDALEEVGRDTPTNVRARFENQAFLTWGVWTAQTYAPLLGVTYDGERTQLDGAQLHTKPEAEDVADWMASAGTFAHVTGYVPLVGYDYDVEPGLVERMTVGTYAGTYDAFVPIVSALWQSDRPFITWAQQLQSSRAPSDGTLDVGPVVAGTFVPLARYEADAGDADLHSVSVVGTRLGGACRGGSEVGVDALGQPLAALRLAVPPALPEVRPLAGCA